MDFGVQGCVCVRVYVRALELLERRYSSKRKRREDQHRAVAERTWGGTLARARSSRVMAIASRRRNLVRRVRRDVAHAPSRVVVARRTVFQGISMTEASSGTRRCCWRSAWCGWRGSRVGSWSSA